MQRKWSQAILRGTEHKDKRQQIKVDMWEIPTRYKKKDKKPNQTKSNQYIKVVKHRNRMLRGVRESPFLKILKP